MESSGAWRKGDNRRVGLYVERANYMRTGGKTESRTPVSKREESKAGFAQKCSVEDLN